MRSQPTLTDAKTSNVQYMDLPQGDKIQAVSLPLCLFAVGEKRWLRKKRLVTDLIAPSLPSLPLYCIQEYVR